MPAPDREKIRITDGIDVVVPASNTLMTPFVLKEQKDWFEDEIRFVRRLLQPGMHAIDIGANYGVYSLSIARRIGDQGKLWSFEPTGSVVQCPDQSIRENEFHNITLIKAALSNREGTAKLCLSPNAEINSIVHDVDSGIDVETVDITTLDACSRLYDWQRMDFVKLDAEGEEERIIEGGRSVLEKLSPVVLYELKHGNEVNLRLVDRFEDRGYRSFCLLPGPMTLVPFDRNVEPDGFQLNLFAMKADAADRLFARGLLVKDLESEGRGDERSVDPDLWNREIGKKNYARKFRDAWVKALSGDDTYAREYSGALNFYVQSQDEDCPMHRRVQALFQSETALAGLLARKANASVAITYTRVLFDIGKRSVAVSELAKLLNRMTTEKNVRLDLPFIPTLPRYEKFKLRNAYGDWLLSSLLEPFELKKSFSSYFTGKAALKNLELLKSLGFCESEIGRRIDLLRSV